MVRPLRTPRLNNNDDAVRLTRLHVNPGDAVTAGDVVAEVETEKTSVSIDAEHSGFVLAVLHRVNDVVGVGSVLLWIGESPDEAIPETARGSSSGHGGGRATLKAERLLEQYGLAAAEIPTTRERITADDVQRYVETRGLTSKPPAREPSAAPAWHPGAAGTAQPLTPEERAMMRTVLWQRDEAVPAYVELESDAAEWERFAARYRQRERLVFDPLLALMAYRLVALARQNSRLSSTIVGDQRWLYESINLGFTVQSDVQLYLAVVTGAAALTCRQFVDRIFELQRRAVARKLSAHEASGATIAFSSMARWNVSRHIPVLPPGTALIVAHSATSGCLRLGATYDHRALTGFEVFSTLSALSVPEEEA